VTEWHADVVASDGGTVHVRPIRPDDAERLVAFHARLSAETIYYRFFSPRPQLSAEDVQRFTNVDGVARMALIALLGDDMVAVARYDGEIGTDGNAAEEAEVAFTVRDDHQGRGLSTILFEHLAAYARTKGIRRFVAEVLPDNRKMLGVFRSVGFAVRQEFDSGIVDVVLDLDPSDAAVERIAARELRADARALSRFLSARSIALMGASRNPDHIGNRILRRLIDGGFAGVVHPIHPTAVAIGGMPAAPSLVDVGGPIDLAIVAVPAEAVSAALDECIAASVRSVIIVSAGVEDSAELARRARRNGIRLIGPASFGVIAPGSRLAASWSEVAIEPGPVTISSQSGPLGGVVLERMARHGLGLRLFVSLGDRVDISGNDVLAWAESDAQTGIVLMHTQTFGNPAKFARLARLVSARTPIVAVKPRDPDDLIVDALYDQTGVIRVESVSEQLDVARLFATSPLPHGRRVAIVATASGPARLAAGGVRSAGLDLATVSPATGEELGRRVPVAVSMTNPIDLGFRATPGDVGTAIEVLSGDESVDAILVVDAPAAAIAPLREADALIDLVAARRGDVPVAVVGFGRRDAIVGGVPVFAETRSALVALGHAARRTVWLQRPQGEVAVLEEATVVAAQAIVDRALGAHPVGTLLTHGDAQQVLRQAGIAVANGVAVTSRDRAVEAAAELEFPLVVKSARRTGRSAAGGVALDLADVRSVGRAWDRMVESLGASAMAEAVVQEMAPAGVETRIAVVPHPDFGAAITFGFGGLYGDEIGDVSAAAVPVTDADAARLVERTRAFDAISRIGGSVDAVADVICRLSALIDDVQEIDRVMLDPVLVSSSGAVVVDATIHVAPAAVEAIDLPIRRV
jgi:acyl-CoA synthetase (NDP forming)/GNAT superfamily N-acetyltransferase